MRAVITVIGKDNVGILHQVSGVCAKYQANVLEVTQSVLQDMFAMIMMVDITAMTTDFTQPVSYTHLDDMIKLLLLTSIPEQRFQTAVQRHLQPVEWLLHRTACPQWTYRSACLLHYSRRG